MVNAETMDPIELAAAKDHEGLKKELEKHNIKSKYEEFLSKDKDKKEKKIMPEAKVVNIIIERLNRWSAQFDTLISIIEYDEKFLGKFSPENRLLIMDSMKPLVKKAKRFDELAEKTILKISP